MLELINKSSYAANLYPGFGQDGKHQLTCVIKAGFNFNEQGKLLGIDTPPVIEETDRFSGAINKSSLVATSEIMPFKEKSEILLYGTAQVPHKNSLISEVSVKIKWPKNKIWQKQLRIFGERTWQRTFLGTIPSRPKPLTPIPIQYKYAFGGEGYATNPIGMGYKNKYLPHIELMPKIITKITDQPPPGGFAPIPAYWQAQNLSLAPKDQQFDQPFNGDEIISLKGLLQQEVAIKIPDTKPKLILNLDQQQITLTAKCDTVIINTDEQTIYLIWRTGIPWQVNDQRNGTLMIK